jgi:uncharacterized membrane protein YidH (DUF202 family)
VNRSSGVGLTVFGIVLVTVGAAMRFAVSAHASGFNIHTAGVTLLLVEIGTVVLGLLILALEARAVARRERTSGRLPQANSGPSSGTTGASPKG